MFLFKGDQAASQHFLNLCMEKDPSIPDIHLLQAKLHLHAGDYSKCLSSLESGVSYNFEVSQKNYFFLLTSSSAPRLHYNEFFQIYKPVYIVNRNI